MIIFRVNVYINRGGVTVKSLQEPKLVATWGDLNRFLGFAFLIVGIVTAALDKTFGGFAPFVWFLPAIFFFIIVVCTEIVLFRLSWEGKKEK